MLNELGQVQFKDKRLKPKLYILAYKKERKKDKGRKKEGRVAGREERRESHCGFREK